MKNKDKRDDIEYMSDAEMEQLFEEINKDPEIRDVVPPPGMRDRVFQAIQNLEDRKKQERQKYLKRQFVFLAALILIIAICVLCIESFEKFFIKLIL